MSDLTDYIEEAKKQMDWVVGMREDQLSEEQAADAFRELEEAFEQLTFEEACEKANNATVSCSEEVTFNTDTVTINWDTNSNCPNSTSYTYVIYPSDSNNWIILDELFEGSPEMEALETAPEKLLEEGVSMAPRSLLGEPESLDSRFGTLSEIPRK